MKCLDRVVNIIHVDISAGLVGAIGPGTYFGLSGLSGLLEYTALQEAQDMLVQSGGSVLHSI
ncbi:uncharacterized protein N7506_011322 [Penicillium brevicompactum]|uniref:uncharacterized protein n=1 Tax=Penicillium brevicompactum TaxID=5074 RepID=UPI0025424024|nr:uncharacterized protein N7506_011322 [Penicillium brevicompactum]KAJ5322192.1 hypothetical protein N7506_011322 [Penicillium brevicompactum]